MPKIGLEIHQQLNTNKLFCSCPSKIENIENMNKKIRRRLRMGGSEFMEIDEAAKKEFEKGFLYEYLYNNEIACLVELDEEPPKEINKEALEVALGIAKKLEMEIPDVGYVMRKTVVDGSNVSGFQRTLLVGLNGKIRVGEREVSVETLCLEEDSARIIETKGNIKRYSLDRLGIPLIEITTSPEATNGNEAMKLAKAIGELFWLTGKVKRGLGTIRQDVNVSVEGGTRVELKGVQELSLIKKAVEAEIERQKDLIKLKNKFPEEIKFGGLVEIEIKGRRAYAFKIENFSGFMGMKVGKRRFGSEVSDYVKTHTTLRGLIHKDEAEKFFTKEEQNLIKTRLMLGENDSFILFYGNKKEAEKGMEIAIKRILLGKEGVLPEVRGVKEDGSSFYLRPIPGKARMYPETDLEPIIFKKYKPLEIEDKEERIKYLKSLNLSEKIIEQLLFSPAYVLGKDLFSRDAKVAANICIFLNKLDDWELREFGKENALLLFKALKEERITKEDIPKLLKTWKKGKNLEKAIREVEKGGSEEEIKNIVKKIIKEKEEYIKKEGDRAFSGLMGEIRKRHPNLNPKKVAKVLKEELKMF